MRRTILAVLLCLASFGVSAQPFNVPALFAMPNRTVTPPPVFNPCTVSPAIGCGQVVGSGTTPAFDSTGATLLVLAISQYSGAAQATWTDSKGNAWTAAASSQTGSVENRCLLYMVANPTVGAGHTVTMTNPTGVAQFAAFSGVNVSPVDQSTGAAHTGGTATTTFQPGSITPSQNNSLTITSMGQNTATTAAIINSGFTILSQNPLVTGVTEGGGLAYLKQTTAAPVNPTWTVPTATTDWCSIIADFKP